MAVRQLSRVDARRIAVRAQLLDRDSQQRLAADPDALVGVVDHLTMLQIDPTAAIAPNADLVAWSRLGSAYAPGQLVTALEHDHTLFELNAYVRPVTALPFHVPGESAYLLQSQAQDWLAANDRFRRDILTLLADAGPLASRDIPDTAQVPWGSTGWTNNRNVTQILEMMAIRGQVAIARRTGKQRVWDLPERVYPAYEPLPPDEARHRREERRLRSLGIARAKVPVMPGEPISVGDAGVLVSIDGVAGEWRVDPAALDQPFTGRTALLSPFDRLIHDRVRAQQLFDFEYILEMYKPAARRRWGYFALPVLHEDRLIGKLDAKADRKAGVLRVHAIHPDVRFTRRITAAVDAEIESLAAWLGLTVARD